MRRFASFVPVFALAALATFHASSALALWNPLFRGAEYYDVGSWPDSGMSVSCPADIAAGDVNGDGYVDLVSANTQGQFTNGGTTVSVLLHNKNNSFFWMFDKKKNFTVLQGPYEIALADMNKDGKLDVVVGYVNGGVSVLFGNGAGGFAAHVDYATPGTTNGLGIADLNGDTWPDVAVGAGAGVAVLLGTGGGALGAYATYATGGLTVRELRAGDATGDGIPDVVVVGGQSALVAVLVGNNTGALPVVSGPFASGGSDAYDVAIGNFNGDAFPDLVTCSPTAGVIGVHLGMGSNAFDPVTTYDTGLSHSPASLAVGDVDGDGTADLVTIMSHSTAVDRSLAVLHGDGSGGFSTPSYATLAPNAWEILLADFDQDGALDVATSALGDIISNPQAHEIIVLRNNGSGVFRGSIVGPAAGTSPDGLALADFNRDGSVDMAECDADRVRINLGNGTGVFTQGPSAMGLPDVYFRPIAGDLNLDGIPDLVVQSSGVQLAQGIGDGTFKAVKMVLAGSYFALPRSVVDMDRDSRPDLVVVDATTVEVLTQIPSGTFTPHPARALAGGPWDLTTGDWNRDGKPDVAVGTNSGLSVLLGGGDGTLGVATTLGAGRSYGGVCTGDFNRDGKPDIAAREITGLGQARGIDVYLGDGSGGFARTTSSSFEVHGTFIDSWDTNLDGFPDLVSVGLSNGFGFPQYTSLSIHTGNGTSSFPLHSDFALGIRNDDVPVVGDVNRDGVPDIVNHTHAYTRPSTLTDAIQTVLATPPVHGSGLDPNIDYMALAGTQRVALGDLNRDGTLDLITGSPTSDPGVTVRLGNGSGSFGGATTLAQSTEVIQLALSDLNRDGILDLVTVSSETATTGIISSMLGVGNGTFGPRVDLPVSSVAAAMRVVDVNQDGIPDVVMATSNTGLVLAYAGVGDGTFTGGPAPQVLSGVTAFDVADINRDGIPDVIAVNGDVNILLGTSSGAFAPPDVQTIGGTAIAVAVGDFDSDGSLDIAAVADDVVSFLAVLRGYNTGTLTQTNTNLPAAPSDIRIGHAEADADYFAYISYAGTNAVQLFKLSATGAGTSTGTYTTGASPQRLVLADVDRDALPDVITANQTLGSISVLLHGIGPVTAVAMNSAPAARPHLDQNFPNPFNPSTTIRYSLPRRERAEVRVFDIRGRLVSKLVDGVMEAGPHEVAWHGRNGEGHAVGSGVYFYRLTTEHGEAISRRMVILK